MVFVNIQVVVAAISLTMTGKAGMPNLFYIDLLIIVIDSSLAEISQPIKTMRFK